MSTRSRQYYYAQVDNGDPFAPPAWRSPVYRTPESAIAAVQLARFLGRTARFLVRHPLLDLAAGLIWLTWARASWPGLVVLGVTALTALTVLRLWRPDWFTRLVTVPVRSRWRWWCYRRRWQEVMEVGGLAAESGGRRPGPGARQGHRRSVRRPRGGAAGVRAISAGVRRPDRQHGTRPRRPVVPGAHRRARPVVLELVRRDALATVIPVLPVPAVTDLRALPVGRREDGRCSPSACRARTC